MVDYFFATSDPIANQDGPKPYGYVTVDANPASTVVEKTLADIQGTGHLDPVIGLESESQANNSGASGVYWYEYPASGKLTDPWIRHTIIGSGYAYEDMLALDVNGDGAVDIVCSFGPSGSNPEIVWFQNPRGQGGNPITDTWTMHVVGPGTGENSLLMADIDGDGKMDIVTATIRISSRIVQPHGRRSSTAHPSAGWLCWILVRGREASIWRARNQALLSIFRGGRIHEKPAETRGPARGSCTASDLDIHAAPITATRELAAAKWRRITRSM